ncbi:alanyl-tRNA editing protein [Pseudomonas syringae pv. tagetis]|uniref:Alanyl-tRNA editing protein n=3 Tax=Pseudomonas TaxID=286 RepID=A0A0N8T551_9PSED|nr:alanyl-tRNA editing protein [Pseudomonas syringae group genomosp. 7]KPY90216.1 Ser-tRNA deacylase [Pseudomonas syringae pv. tagetis]RMR10678.1 Ser-tRNA deacylase [Pseudomonas syringae pv. helianthi]RMV44228.1 Ser-tRNA deacylase [Pseudomonas syringae pv. helianthi]RMW19301.1 Ser-tRNA deacylase [Pseudomonas syringae pv. tagetis]UNB67867.1 alanyl-tRNA editing protein [Pseudomonas syringae pv. tagetis]
MNNMAMDYGVLRNTEKLYYKDKYLMSASTKVTRVHSEAIELDRTVAYPEGGGQEADVGTIELCIGVVRFVWVKKLYGTPIRLEGFKGGKVGGIILHMIHPDDLYLLDKIDEGMTAQVKIDILRRERLTLSHSASHFLYAAATSLRVGLEQWTTGCHIKEKSARFDFLVDEPLSADDVAEIELRANELIVRNELIESHSVQGLEDARMWVYQDIEIPCGGTHLDTPQAIGYLSVRRKRLGKGKERLICEFPDAVIDLSLYHENIL